MQNVLILGGKKSLEGIKVLLSYPSALKAALQVSLGCDSWGWWQRFLRSTGQTSSRFYSIIRITMCFTSLHMPHSWQIKFIPKGKAFSSYLLESSRKIDNSWPQGNNVSVPLTCCSMVWGWMKATKSTEKYPSTPFDLQVSPIFKQSELRTAGSTERCGMVVPDDRKGPSAWSWSPDDTIFISPVGSISTSTVRLVTFSERGKASITPPSKTWISC